MADNEKLDLRTKAGRDAKAALEAQSGTDTDVLDAPKPTAKKLDLGENKQYTRYQVQVTPHLINRFGTQVFDRYEIIVQNELLTNIRIEPKRANQLNRKVHSTNQLLIEDGAKLPIKIIRKMREDGDNEIDGGYVDTYIYE